MMILKVLIKSEIDWGKNTKINTNTSIGYIGNKLFYSDIIISKIIMMNRFIVIAILLNSLVSGDNNPDCKACAANPCGCNLFKCSKPL